MKFNLILHSGVVLLLTLAACSESRKQKIKEEKQKEEKIIEAIPEYIPGFYLDTLRNTAEIDSFKLLFSDEELTTILALNRIDLRKFRDSLVIVLPDSLSLGFYDFSPFPKTIPAFDTVSRIIFVSREIQAFAAYENGKLFRWGPTSTGKKSTPTPNGLFYTNWKKERKISTESDEWILPWYFNIHNKRGIAFHQYELPGYPASHACIRLREEDAKWIYDWADQWELTNKGMIIVRQGTPVIIFGEYDHDTIKPWLQLDSTGKMIRYDENHLLQFSDTIFTKQKTPLI